MTQPSAGRRLPPLNALRAFEAAARCASFTRAAQELCVTQGAVSRHVGTLEDWLSVRLFERTRQGIVLTPPGQQYFLTVRAALDQIAYGTRLLRAQPDDRLLRIKLPPTFAIRWLVPRLAKFHAMNPDIDVQITTSHQRVDFAREEIDVSIQSEARPSEVAGFRKLFDETLVVVCAPGLLARGKPLMQPSDLIGQVTLCSMNRPHDWPAWLAAAGVSGMDGNQGLKFENAGLACQAAVDQLGVMVALTHFVQDDLAAGRLVAPFALEVPTAGAYGLLLRGEAAELPDRVRRFADWIQAEASAPMATLPSPSARSSTKAPKR